jgi:hypothetical protein
LYKNETIPVDESQMGGGGRGGALIFPTARFLGSTEESENASSSLFLKGHQYGDLENGLRRMVRRNGDRENKKETAELEKDMVCGYDLMLLSS